MITCKVTSGTQQKMGPRRIYDFILWYAKEIRERFREVSSPLCQKTLGEGSYI